MSFRANTLLRSAIRAQPKATPSRLIAKRAFATGESKVPPPSPGAVHASKTPSVPLDPSFTSSSSAHPFFFISSLQLLPRWIGSRSCWFVQSSHLSFPIYNQSHASHLYPITSPPFPILTIHHPSDHILIFLIHRRSLLLLPAWSVHQRPGQED